VEQILMQQKELLDKFILALGENSKHEEFLSKVFKRKVKRAKVFKTTAGDINDVEKRKTCRGRTIRT
jgi:hypothetical protein